MSRCLVALFSIWFSIGPVTGQSPTLLENLEQDLKAGKSRAIRDLGTLLDREELYQPALQLLLKYTLFTSEEIDFRKKVSRQQILDFFYQNQDEIYFSELLGVFYMTPVERRNASYNIQWRKPAFNGNLEESYWRMVEKIPSNTTLFEDEIQRLEKIICRWPVQSHLLWVPEMLVEKIRSGDLTNPVAIDRTAKMLGWSDNLTSAKTLLEWAEKGMISNQTALYSLSRLTNHYPPSDSLSVLLEFYQNKIGQARNLEILRAQGYSDLFRFKKSFFPHEVDYYGMIAAFSEDKLWVLHNALRDLIQSHHPRALFYLASLVYKTSKSTNTSEQETALRAALASVTNIQLSLQGYDGMYRLEPDFSQDLLAKQNFLFYWANRHVDYIWNPELQIFENQSLKKRDQQKLEWLFLRLQSPNDTLAREAFDRILTFDPSMVKSFIARFEELTPAINPTLPAWRSKCLEMANQLTYWANYYHQATELRFELLPFLEKLEDSLSEKNRYFIENQIIDMGIVSDLSALELWALKHSQEPVVSTSCSRILDFLYQKHWCSIGQNPGSAVLFLRKAGIFQPAQNYWSKFETLGSGCFLKLMEGGYVEIPGELLPHWEEIRLKESWKKVQEQSGHKVQISFDWHYYYLMPPPEDRWLPQLFSEFRSLGPEERYFAKKYIQMHSGPTMVPYLMNLLKEKKETGWIISQLEQIFEYKYEGNLKRQRRHWLQSWKTHRASVRSLGQEAWRSRFIQKSTEKNLDLVELIEFSRSRFADPQCKQILFEWYPNLEFPQPNNTLEIFAANSQQSLSKGSEAQLLATLINPQIKPCYLELFLDHLPPLSLQQKGSLINAILERSSFFEFVENGSIKPQTIEKIIEILVDYQKKPGIWTKAESNLTCYHLFKLRHLSHSTLEMLKASLELEADSALVTSILNTLLKKVTWAEATAVLEIWEKLSENRQGALHNFIQQDFGLPFFDIENRDARTALQERIKKDSKEDLYRFYLVEFGVNFLNENGAIDWEKVEALLSFDLPHPFSGQKAGYRNYAHYGLVKYLECYFGTTLGFADKLNENQQYFQYNSRSRAAAWISFLHQLGPDFSQISDCPGPQKPCAKFR